MAQPQQLPLLNVAFICFSQWCKQNKNEINLDLFPCNQGAKISVKTSALN